MINGLALCAGVGGLELGLALALGDAYITVGYVEREAYAAAALVARMEDEALDRAPVWDDLSTFDGRPWCGCVDLISAGFPCQPASTAGRRQGTDDDRWLWPDIARIVGDVGPQLVFLENVRGLLTVNDGAAFAEVLGDLAALGYAAEWDVFSAAEVGAPHLRERIFLLAYDHRQGFGGQWASGLLERRDALGDDVDRCRADVANGDRRGCGVDGPPAGLGDAGGDHPDRRRSDVADPGQPGHQSGFGGLAEADQRPRPKRAGQPRGRRSAVAYPRLLVQTGWPWAPGAEAGAGSPAEPAGAGGELGDAQRQGRQQGSGLEACARPFPPGPGAAAEWAACLAERPELAPAVVQSPSQRRGPEAGDDGIRATQRRTGVLGADAGLEAETEPPVHGVADRMAYRVDRLRTAGNGVVPIVAAVAFRALAQRLGGPR